VVKKGIEAIVPKPMIERAKSSPTIARLFGRSDEPRVGEISVGVGVGLKFNPGKSNPAYGSGNNELPVQYALAQHLTSGNVLYDVGANVGFLTVIGAHLVGPTGSVYAFEPVPSNTALVRRNAALNGFDNVTVIGKAVSNRSGRGEVALASYAGGAALSTVTAPPDAVGTLPIEVITIDELVFRERLRPPSLVKIDVEGAEIEVLQGMTRTLRECRPVVLYEIDDQDRAAFERKQAGCDTFVRELGYQITRLENSYPDIRWIVGHTLATPR
jgi:FkbM family methyltransferase